jgi:hypothetical protein
VKPSSTLKDNLIDRTRQVWQPRLGDLSSEDARQLVENATGFFALLAEWSRAEEEKSSTGAATSATGATQ